MGRDTLKQFTLFDMKEEVIIEEGEDVQECKICKKIKPFKSFHIKTPLKNNVGILDRTCNECERKSSKERRERRKNMVEPPADYKCPMCKRNKEEINNHTFVVDISTYKKVKRRYPSPWRIDHDHVTGKLRGVICNPCNIKLGAFKNRDELINTIKYRDGEFDGSTGI